MKIYMRQRRLEKPAKELWTRAKKRAQKFNVPFSIEPASLIIPAICPVVGIPLIVGGRRSPNSPSLDRIEPLIGYVSGNIRVISDYANRLKSNRTISEIEFQSQFGREDLRGDYRKIAAYLKREALLKEVRDNLSAKKRRRSDLVRVADLLERVCARGLADA